MRGRQAGNSVRRPCEVHTIRCWACLGLASLALLLRTPAGWVPQPVVERKGSQWRAWQQGSR